MLESGRYFTINPGHSHFTNFLDAFMHRDTARWLGIISAFASIYACWSLKNWIGRSIETWLTKLNSQSKNDSERLHTHRPSDIETSVSNKVIDIMKEPSIVIEPPQSKNKASSSNPIETR